jgi:hypothetical protein
MSAGAGQAPPPSPPPQRGLLGHLGDAGGRTGRVVHRVVQLLLALVIVAGIGVAALVVSLAHGPVDVAWVARRVTRNMITGADVSIGRATLAWQGLSGGMDRTLDLVLSDVDVRMPAGERLVVLRQAAVSLATRPLFRGVLAPTSVDVDGAAVRLHRDAGGGIGIEGAKSSTTSGAAPRNMDAMLASLGHVRISGSRVDVADDQLSVPWALDAIAVDIERGARDGAQGGGAQGGGAPGNGARGDATTIVSIGGESIPVNAKLALLPGGAGLTASAKLGTLNLARIGALSPVLAGLRAMEADLHLSAELALGSDFAWRSARVTAQADAGIVRIGDGVMPIRSANVEAALTPSTAEITVHPLVLRARDEAAPTNFNARISARRGGGKVDATVVVDVDQVAFSDLPALWPAGVGGPGTRPWITQNITAGVAHDGHVEAVVSAPDDFSDATLVSISGGIDGSDVTGHWLRPVPPIEHGTAKVVFVDPDTLDILIANGRQVGGQLMLKPSRVRLTGIAGHDQFIAIQGDITGPFADLISLLKQPKINLLSRRPIDLRDPQGTMTGQLTVNFPLKTDLDIDKVAIHAVGKLTGGHLTGIAVGRNLDRAMLDFDVGNDGLKIVGTCDVATIPAKLSVEMDFKSGGPAQVMEKIGVSATLTPKNIAGFGLNVDGVMTGTVDVQLDYFDRRDSTGDIKVTGDLAHAAFTGGRVPFNKAAGSAGSLDAHVLMKAGKITGIDRIVAEAPGLSVQVAADVAGGRPNVVRIQRFILGEATNVTGEVRLPERDGQPYVATITGPTLDASGEFDRKAEADPKTARSRTNAPFRADIRIDRVLMAGGRPMNQVVAHVENDGTLTTNARLSAVVGTGPALLSLTPVQGGRKLAAEAQDAGALLRTLDLIQSMSGGRLTASGMYNDTTDAHTLRGSAELLDFRIRNAPSIGRILQGMSLYGLVQLAQGPGLGFTRMVVPFRLSQEVLTLEDARAYSASLGITAKGSIDLARSTANMEGTVVPAYFFNSLLGRVPLLGRLFAPEQGGGVFAATYSVKGPLDDPTVSVNPLAALTPGFLRGFFDIFDGPSAPASREQAPKAPAPSPAPSTPRASPPSTLTEPQR